MQQRRLATPSMAQRLETTGTEFERNGFVVSKEEREDPVYLPEAVYAEKNAPERLLKPEPSGLPIHHEQSEIGRLLVRISDTNVEHMQRFWDTPQHSP